MTDHAFSVDHAGRTTTGINLARFCPPAPQELEDWLARVIPPDAPSINIGGTVPCLGEPLFVPADPLDLAEIDPRSRRRSDRWFWTLMQDMEAAFMRDVQGQGSVAVRDFLGLHDQPEIASYAKDDFGGERERSRSAERRIKSGREAWHRLGGVPWAFVSQDKLWTLGHDWWLDREFVENVFAPKLAAWHEHHRNAAEQETRTRQRALRRHAPPFRPAAPRNR